MMDLARAWPHLTKTSVVIREVSTLEDDNGMIDETINDRPPIDAYISKPKENYYTARAEGRSEIVTRNVFFLGNIPLEMDYRLVFDNREWDFVDYLERPNIGKFTKIQVKHRP